MFTRGQTNPGLFPQAEHLRGDRDGDLKALEGRTWDAVIDNSGYVPRIVRQSAELLRDAIEHYLFVSSISVYADLPGENTEESALSKLPDPDTESIQEHYGALKAASEDVVRETFGERTAIVRPGLIVGPHDPTGRFTYWPTRMERGGDVLAPEPRRFRVQFVDVRDLAGWMVRMAEERRGGTFNAVGPAEPLTMGRFLETTRQVVNPEARLVWADAEFLLERDVEEWVELPLWFARHEEHTDISRALAAGLEHRPLEETIGDTLAWARELGDRPLPRRAGVQLPEPGLPAERERELLAEWHERLNT